MTSIVSEVFHGASVRSFILLRFSVRFTFDALLDLVYYRVIYAASTSEPFDICNVHLLFPNTEPDEYE